MNPDKEKSWFIDVNAMCGKSSHFSLRGMGFVSSMLQYYMFELLVASEDVQMNKIPSSKYPGNSNIEFYG